VRTFVTPDSNSILRSVTRLSLEDIAQKLGWKVEERAVALKEVEEGKFEEVAACGTAAIITPVKKIVRGDQTILMNIVVFKAVILRTPLAGCGPRKDCKLDVDEWQ